MISSTSSFFDFPLNPVGLRFFLRNGNMFLYEVGIVVYIRFRSTSFQQPVGLLYLRRSNLDLFGCGLHHTAIMSDWFVFGLGAFQTGVMRRNPSATGQIRNGENGQGKAAKPDWLFHLDHSGTFWDGRPEMFSP